MNTKFTGILIAVCACVVVIVLALNSDDSDILSREGVATTGQVISIELHSGGTSGDLYETKFSFDAEGKPRIGWTLLASERANSLKVGSEVPVVYKPGKPNFAKLGKPGEFWDAHGQE